MSRYLYGASVHHIQSLIFETGKLKEIVGASELIEQICTSRFAKEVGARFNPENLLIGAAGKIKYIFEDMQTCQDIVKRFTAQIMQEIPGMVITQAVVPFEGDLEEMDRLKLDKYLEIQRNRAYTQHGLGLMITERSRRTGGAGVLAKIDGEEIIIDQKQRAKYKQRNKDHQFAKILGEDHNYPTDSFPKMIEHLLYCKETGWVAIIHADGNNLGHTIHQLIQELGDRQSGTLQSFLRQFSKKLDYTTQLSVQKAFAEVVAPVVAKESRDSQAYIPLRPVLLGGDDLTLIIRGELAMDFTNVYLKSFAKNSKIQFGSLAKELDLPSLNNGFSACAGIAYVKSNYPFHYGVDLADELCSYAKKKAKAIHGEQVPSCLAFHKIQSSFVEEYKDVIKKELTAKADGHLIQFNYGPYFTEPQSDFVTIDKLKKWVKEVNRHDAPKSPLREWLSELTVNQAKAKQLMKRIMEINPRYVDRLDLHPDFQERQDGDDTNDYTHLHDVLSLASIEK